MWPQKWNASACCVFSAAATKPPPATPSKTCPARARKPRRELEPATASLSFSSGTYGPCSQGRCQQALQLEKRVERPLGEHLAVAPQHDRVRAAGHVQRRPGVGVLFLVEELEDRKSTRLNSSHVRIS